MNHSRRCSLSALALVVAGCETLLGVGTKSFDALDASHDEASASDAGMFDADGEASVPNGDCIDEFAIPTEAAHPIGIALGPDDHVWFTETNTQAIERMTVAGAVRQMGKTVHSPLGIVAGPKREQVVWYSARGSGPTPGSIGRISLTGIISEFALPCTPEGSPTLGPDDNIWFVCDQGRVGRMTPEGAQTFHRLPAADSGVRGELKAITSAAGKLWILERYPDREFVIRFELSGASVAFPLPSPTPPLRTHSIVPSPDGLWLWFSSSVRGVGNISQSGVVNLYTAEIDEDFAERYRGLAFDADGALWVTDSEGDRIGRLSLPAGVFDWFELPELSQPYDIVRGPDDKMWFTERLSNRIGRIDPSCARAQRPRR